RLPTLVRRVLLPGSLPRLAPLEATLDPSAVGTDLRLADVDQAVRQRVRRLARRSGGGRARRRRIEIAAGAHREPLDLAGRRRRMAREVGATRARDAHEVSLVRLEPQLDARGRGRLSEMEEPLPVVALDPLVVVAVRVRAVEDAAGDVVHAEVEPGVRAAGAEPVTSARHRLLGDLPVDVETILIDDHGGHAVLSVAPRDVLGCLRLLVGPQVEPPC